jgi:energy-coupling factor transporter ATP-binding protein EcfA2
VPNQKDWGERGIAMLGTTGSGKTTFLCALERALIEQEGDWLLYCRDPASMKLLDEMSSALTSEGRFPLPSLSVDTMDWILSGQVEQTQRTELPGRRLRSRTLERVVRERIEMTLKLTDATGELGKSEHIGLADRKKLVDHLAGSQGILYMFDPIREFRTGDAYQRTSSLLRELLGQASNEPGFDGRLPHHVAVCVTKLDEPRVFKTAQELRMLVSDDYNQWGFPRVHESDAQALLQSLCSVSRTGNGEGVPRLLEKCFHPERISYFATSAVGFMVNKRTNRFDIQDTENVYRTASGRSLVRGPVHPINVVEPVLRLVRQLTASK